MNDEAWYVVISLAHQESLDASLIVDTLVDQLGAWQRTDVQKVNLLLEATSRILPNEQFTKKGGAYVLVALQDHPTDQIYEKVEKLLSKHFGEETD